MPLGLARTGSAKLESVKLCRDGMLLTLWRNTGKKGSELDGLAMSRMSRVTASWCLTPHSGKNLAAMAAAKMW